MAKEIRDYLRVDKLPHIWCPGCGHGIIVNAALRAIAELDIPKDDICIVSGIGCASRAPGYLDFNTLHTTHGRALAFATGIKVANPKLNVIVLTGDGDATAIGGNHLIHAARRNIGITTICMNNSIYGMTNGQYSPMTPAEAYATTAPYGNVERNFDLCLLTKNAGANYVARGTIANSTQLSTLIKKSIEHDGFSFVEAVTQCPTYFGRKNKMGQAVDMIKDIKKASVSIQQAEKMTDEELVGKIITGEFYVGNAQEYTKRYDEVIKRAKASIGTGSSMKGESK